MALQASAPDAVVDLARRGLGVAILSESMAGLAGDLARVPLTGADVPAVLALIWRSGSNPALHELLRHCRTTFRITAATGRPSPAGDGGGTAPRRGGRAATAH